MLLLRSPRVVDVVSGAVTAPLDVLIEGHEIASLNDAKGGAVGEQEIDCSGKYLIPGLFDCHTHLASLTIQGEDSLKKSLSEFVDRGVLYARDVGGPIDVMREMHHRIGGGELSGPEIFYAGPMLESSPLQWERHNKALPGFTVAIDSEDDARRLLPELAEQGASIVKTFNNIALPLYRQLLDVARECSLKVVHDPGRSLFNWVPVDKAIELGVTSIEHGKAPWPYVLEDGLRERQDEVTGGGADPEEQTKVLMDVAEAGIGGVSEERLHALARLMLEHGAVLCPTLYIFEAWRKEGAEAADPKEGEVEAEDPRAQMARIVKAAMEEISYHFVGALCRDGVRMLLGSDTPSAAATIEEAKNMRTAGISEIDVLRAATIYPAQWLGVDDRLGSIGPGKAADLVVLNANPLEDIRNLGTIAAVVQHGAVVGARHG